MAGLSSLPVPSPFICLFIIIIIIIIIIFLWLLPPASTLYIWLQMVLPFLPAGEVCKGYGLLVSSCAGQGLGSASVILHWVETTGRWKKKDVTAVHALIAARTWVRATWLGHYKGDINPPLY